MPEWKPAPGWAEFYEVSDDGRIRKKGGAEVGQWANDQGYMIARLARPRTQISVHRLVAKAFIPNPERKPSINHRNNDRADNAATNLEWCTQGENISHAARQGRMRTNQAVNRGSGSPNARLTEGEVCNIRRSRSEGVSFQKLADAFGVSKRTIQRICSGERWSHV